MERFEVRDRRNGFLWITNSFFDAYITQLQPSSLLVYLALARLANNDTQKCFPSYETIAEMTGVVRSTVALALQDLKDLGLLEWSKDGRHNVYSLLETTSPKIGLVRSDSRTSPIQHANQSDVPDPNKTQNNTQEQYSLSPPSSEGVSKNSKKTDSRHRVFMELIFKAHKYYVKVDPLLGPAAGSNLKRLLNSQPNLNKEQFIVWLENYHTSENHNPADSPAHYIPRLKDYELGTLNKFGRPNVA